LHTDARTQTVAPVAYLQDRGQRIVQSDTRVPVAGAHVLVALEATHGAAAVGFVETHEKNDQQRAQPDRVGGEPSQCQRATPWVFHVIGKPFAHRGSAAAGAGTVAKEAIVAVKLPTAFAHETGS